MDKKNFIIGIICLFAAFTLFFNEEKQLRENSKKSPTTISNTETLNIETNPEPNPEIPQFHASVEKSKIYTLENEFIKVNFTTLGGAIHSVELKKYPIDQEHTSNYIFNDKTDSPALMLAWDPKTLISENFQATKETHQAIQFSVKLSDGTEIMRQYHLNSNPENLYIIKSETLIQQPQFTHNRVFLHLGSMPGTPGDKYLEYLNFGAFNGQKADFKRIADFESNNGFFGIGKHNYQPYLQADDNWTWGALKNQFFAAILTPEIPANSYITFPVKTQSSHTLEGIFKFNLPNSNACLRADYYVGPKDFILLDKMGKGQDQLMQFGFFSAVSKLLLISMRGIHSIIPNWGWTIIVLTIIIKLLMWPITQVQLRSSRKMSAIQEPLKQIREKFKNNPQKLQMETMKLFKENRVNPASGCLPVFIQIPIFIGLYYMLRTSSEVRFQSFLWIKDLSIPDTVATLGSFPINILPLIMGITMFVQMKITPTPSVDGAQQKIIMLMPFIFLIFCYSFPAALVLYWTVQNLFTIFQQWLTNKNLKEAQTTTLK